LKSKFKFASFGKLLTEAYTKGIDQSIYLIIINLRKIECKLVYPEIPG